MLERGLSNNTREGYLNDVKKLLNYLNENNLSLKDVSLDHLHNFIATLHDLGISSRSQARIILEYKIIFKNKSHPLVTSETHSVILASTTG